MCFPYRFYFVQIKLIFVWKVLDEDSFLKKRQKVTRLEMAYYATVFPFCIKYDLAATWIQWLFFV